MKIAPKLVETELQVNIWGKVFEGKKKMSYYKK